MSPDQFDKWVLSIEEMNEIKIPDDMIGAKIFKNDHEHEAMCRFIDVIFPDISSNICNPDWLSGRCILTTNPEDAEKINLLVLLRLPQTVVESLHSTDTWSRKDETMPEIHLLVPKGFPEHLLKLKKGMILILLKDLDPREGLFNGTKLVFQKNWGNLALECKIEGSSKTVLLPRITFRERDWSRKQFPVKQAFATLV